MLRNKTVALEVQVYDTKSVKSILSTIENIKAVNSDTKSQQNKFFYVLPNTVETGKKHVDRSTYDTHSVLLSKSPEAI